MCSPLILLAQLFSTAQAAAIVVAVEDGGSSGTSAELAAQLNDDTYFDFTATVVTAGDIDTATELAAYDVVILGDSGYNETDWTSTMAAALDTWNNAGLGGVVSVGWVDWVTGPGATVLTSIDNVQPIDSYSYGYSYCSGTTSYSTLSTHDITTGVATTLYSGANNIEGSPSASDSTNGTVIGVGSCGDNTVVVGEYGSGRHVYLGYLYMAASGYANTSLRAGDWDRLLEQAVAWSVDALDSDGDGVVNSDDNCPSISNPLQTDTDGDDVGDDCDVCEGDDATGDADGDLYCADEDCDDGDDSVYPAATELCDGQLNDCDGLLGVDEVDVDLDGYVICALDTDGWDGTLKHNLVTENKETRQLVDKNDGKVEGLLQNINKTVGQVEIKQTSNEQYMNQEFGNFNTLSKTIIEKLTTAEQNIAALQAVSFGEDEERPNKMPKLD